MSELSKADVPGGLTLKMNVLWTFGGNVVAAACQWGLLALLTHQMPDATTGQFVMAVAICTPIFMGAGLDLRVLQVTDAVNRFRFTEYLALRLAIGVVVTLLIPTVTFLFGADASTSLVMAGVALQKLVELLADIFYGVMQKAERMDFVSRSVVLHGVGASLATGIGVFVTGSLLAGVLAAVFIRVAILALNDIPRATRLAWQNRAPEERSLRDALQRLLTLNMARPARLIVHGGPLAAKQLVVSLNTQVSRYFVGGLGLAAVGVFGPIASAVTAATTISRALNQSVAARLGRLAGEQRYGEFRSLIARLQCGYLMFGLCGVLVAILFGERLLAFAYRPEFAEYNDVLILIVLAVAVQYQCGILDIGMVALRRVNALVSLSTLALVATSLACWLLVPIWEMQGAAAAMIVGRAVQMLALNVLMAVELRERRAAIKQPLLLNSRHEYQPVIRGTGT